MALRQTLSTGTSESSIVFFNGGHNHNGISSSLIDTSKYSIYDFTTDFLGAQARQQGPQATNYGKFKEVIARIVKEDVLTIAGIKLLPNEVQAVNISAGAVTANALAANIVLVNNRISSNNFDGTIAANGIITGDGTAGWAITSAGDAVFSSASIRGVIQAGALYLNATNYWDVNGDVSIGNVGGNAPGLYYDSANSVLAINGEVFAASGQIAGWTIDGNNLTASGFPGYITIGPTAYSATGEAGMEIAFGTYQTNMLSGGLLLQGEDNLIDLTTSSPVQVTISDGTQSTILSAFGVTGGNITSLGELQGDYLNITGNGVYYNASILAGFQTAGIFPISLCYRIAGGRYYIVANNDVNTLGTINWTPSDRRIKENISPISSDILDKFYSINVYKFNWNDKAPSFLDRGLINVGVIADELKGIIPDAVDDFSPDDDEVSRWASVEYEKIVPYAIAAIQDLNSKIQALEARIAELEG